MCIRLTVSAKFSLFFFFIINFPLVDKGYYFLFYCFYDFLSSCHPRVIFLFSIRYLLFGLPRALSSFTCILIAVFSSFAFLCAVLYRYNFFRAQFSCAGFSPNHTTLTDVKIKIFFLQKRFILG